LEADTAIAQIIQHVYQVANTPPQPVEFPNDEGIAGPDGFQATEQGRAPGAGPRQTPVLKDVTTPHALKRRHLKGSRLVVSAGAGIPIFHDAHCETDL
jgi:hypothetical protein